MAEQFILPRATSKLVRNFLKAVPGCTITALMHTNVGWNVNSRAQYDGMMGLNGVAAIVGRNGLPPHFYIEIASQTKVSSTGDTDLVRYLSRGVVPVVLKALDATSQGQWAEGRCFEALNTELAKGNVSICIYHLDGVEVTPIEQAKVNGFPRKA